MKYWYYRYRLVNDFMIDKGTEVPSGSIRADFGMSMPANEREYWGSGSYNRLHYGDGTIYLAYYMAILAMEYKLFNDRGINNTATLNELYLAIDAFNRLDYYSEQYYGTTPMQPSLNGFFVREEVGRGIYLEIPATPSTIPPDLNPLWTAYTGVAPSYNGKLNNNPNASLKPVTQMISGWTKNHVSLNHHLWGESKDQIIHLFYALSVIKKVIPPTTLVPTGSNGQQQYFMDGETNFQEEAKLITKRILDYIHPPNEGNTVHKWTIIDPEGNRVDPGYNLWSLAYGYSKVYKRITGSKNPKYTVGSGTGWLNAKSVFMNAWRFYPQIFQFTKGELWKVLALVAESNCCSADDDLINTSAFHWNNNWGKHNGWYSIPPLWKTLDYGDDDHSKAWFETLLDGAPCYGPYNFGNSHYQTFDWSSSSLTVHPNGRGNNNPGIAGEYSGLDYMLLYTMYAADWNIPITANLYDYQEIHNYPYLFGTIGTDANPINRNVMNDILTSKKISSDGNVTYRAGHGINFEMGFEVQSGGDMYAYIDPIECTNQGDEYNRVINETNSQPTKVHKRLEEDDSKILSVLIFPVPFSNQINLHISNIKSGSLTYTINNVYGVELFKMVDTNPSNVFEKFESITTNSLSAGCYILTIRNSEQLVSKRIIKIK
jgi:hypothetical protein